MMRSSPVIKIVVPFLLVGALSMLIGWGIALYSIDFRYLLFLALLMVMIAVFAMGGKRTLQVGFVIWIWMFILGYRTIQLTSYFSLHPLTLLLALLFVDFLFLLKSERRIHLKLPGLLWAFSIFWLWGFIPGAARGLPWSQMFSDALNFFLLIPLFMIILYLAGEVRFWKSAALAFLGAGALIAFLGTLEFYFPSFRSLLPGFIQTDVEGLRSQSGFLRASFSFFGANPAVLISALSLPMVWLVPKFYPGKTAVLTSLVLAAILVVAIYISGTRAAWLMAFIASLLLAYFGRGWMGLGLGVILWGIASRFLPAEAWNLIFSLTAPFASGQIVDTSLQKRFSRQEDAFQLALQNPLGVGWAGSGWVHGDFTQVAANLGLLAGIIFLLWYLQTLYRAWKAHRKYSQDRLLQALLTAFVLCGIVLATEGVQVLTQFVMPIWFIWGLMEAYLQRKNSESFVS